MPFDIVNFLLVFVRASALLAIFPIFSGQNFPVQLRVALALVLALFIAPTLPVVWSLAGLSLWKLIGLMSEELCVGLLLGFVCRLVFYVVSFAGTLIAMEIGLNLAANFNPFHADSEQAPGLLLFYLAGVLFFTLDLHQWVLVAFQRSYHFLPIGGAHLSNGLLEAIARQTSSVFEVGLQMAAPVIAVSFLVLLVFSVLGRAVPQMNVFLESFAFRILAGLAVFGLSLNLMAQYIVNYLHRLPEDLLVVAQLLKGR